MKTIKIGGYNVGLKAEYGEYNCGNKTVGRLELVITAPDSKTNVGWMAIKDELEEPKVRDKIIENYLEDLEDKNTFTRLCDGSKMFPSDTGTYPPGVLIYADSIKFDEGFKWYNHWKALIALFEAEPKFGVVVLKSPILPNRYYGPSRPSRVWTLCLPSISEHVCTDKQHTSPAMKSNLQVVNRKHMPKTWADDIKALGVA